jgi:hypothetical protein
MVRLTGGLAHPRDGEFLDQRVGGEQAEGPKRSRATAGEGVRQKLRRRCSRNGERRVEMIMLLAQEVG